MFTVDHYGTVVCPHLHKLVHKGKGNIRILAQVEYEAKLRLLTMERVWELQARDGASVKDRRDKVAKDEDCWGGKGHSRALDAVATMDRWKMARSLKHYKQLRRTSEYPSQRAKGWKRGKRWQDGLCGQAVCKSPWVKELRAGNSWQGLYWNCPWCWSMTVLRGSHRGPGRSPRLILALAVGNCGSFIVKCSSSIPKRHGDMKAQKVSMYSENLQNYLQFLLPSLKCFHLPLNAFLSPLDRDKPNFPSCYRAAVPTTLCVFSTPVYIFQCH